MGDSEAGEIRPELLRLRQFVPEDDAEVTTWFADAGELRFFAGRRLRWPLTREQWDGIRSDPTINAWTAVAGDDPTPVGHVELVTESPTLVRLARIGIAPSLRGLGLGRRLGELVLELARAAEFEEIELFVHPDNVSAIRAYRGLGFEPQPMPGIHGSLTMSRSLRG